MFSIPCKLTFKQEKRCEHNLGERCYVTSCHVVWQIELLKQTFLYLKHQKCKLDFCHGAISYIVLPAYYLLLTCHFSFTSFNDYNKDNVSNDLLLVHIVCEILFQRQQWPLLFKMQIENEQENNIKYLNFMVMRNQSI